MSVTQSFDESASSLDWITDRVRWLEPCLKKEINKKKKKNTWWRCGWRRHWSCCNLVRRGRLRPRPEAQRHAGGPRGTYGWNGKSPAATVWPAWSHPDASSPWIAEESEDGPPYKTNLGLDACWRRTLTVVCGTMERYLDIWPRGKM